MTGEEAGGDPRCAKCAAKVDPSWKLCASCGQAVDRKPDDDGSDENDDGDEVMAVAKAKATRRVMAIHNAGLGLGIPGAARHLILDDSLRRSQAIALLETLAATRRGAAGSATRQASTAEAAAFVLRAATEAGLMRPEAKPGSARRTH